MINADLATARQLLDLLPGAEQDPLLAGAVVRFLKTDPRRAMQAAHLITDEMLRKQNQVQAVLAVARVPS